MKYGNPKKSYPMVQHTGMHRQHSAMLFFKFFFPRLEAPYQRVQQRNIRMPAIVSPAAKTGYIQTFWATIREPFWKSKKLESNMAWEY